MPNDSSPRSSSPSQGPPARRCRRLPRSPPPGLGPAALIPRGLSGPKHRSEGLVSPTHIDRAVLAQDEGENLFGGLAGDPRAWPGSDVRKVPERDPERAGDAIEAVDGD